MGSGIMHLIITALFTASPAVAGFVSTSSMQSPNRILSLTRPVSAFQLSSQRPTTSQNNLYATTDNDKEGSSVKLDRREALRRTFYQTAVSIAATSAAVLINPAISNADIEGVVSIPQSTSPPEAKSTNIDGQAVTVFKTKSGLQYIDIVEGTGPSPRYGNFVTISYKAYVKLPDIQGKPSKLDEFDSDKGYLIKHGNGRSIPGLDEGLHSMKVGGKRRIIIPPKLGYVTFGLGPVPVGPYGRWKLNRLLDRMVEVSGGNVIFDVEMRNILEDEADQGYYDDNNLTPDEFNLLKDNIEASQKAARGE